MPTDTKCYALTRERPALLDQPRPDYRIGMVALQQCRHHTDACREGCRRPSKLADFQNSDFISAENRKVEFNNPTLEFTHRTARVAIELKPGSGFTSVDGATVRLVSLSADNGNPTAIKTYNASGNTYEALTAPQIVAAGSRSSGWNSAAAPSTSARRTTSY